MENNIPVLVTAGVIFAAATMFFPVEGRLALVMRIVRGIIFGMETFLTAAVVYIKFPTLGWQSATIPLFSVLTVVCFIIMGSDLLKAVPDFFSGQTRLLELSKVKLAKSTLLRESGTEYAIQGFRPDGKKMRIRVIRETFERLREKGDGRADDRLRIEIYPKTKIFSAVL